MKKCKVHAITDGGRPEKKKNISARPIFWARKKTGVLNKVLTQSKKQLEMLFLDLY